MTDQSSYAYGVHLNLAERVVAGSQGHNYRVEFLLFHGIFRPAIMLYCTI